MKETNMSTTIEPIKAEERWLRCQLDKGMFSDEIAVTYPPKGAWQKSVFVECSEVKGGAGELGKVRVVVLRCDGSIIAVLPSPNRDIVYATAEDISEE
jgi:hypothetical protein